MAITSLISNKHECNNCFIKFVKLQNLKYKIRAKKAGKSERNRKKLDEDAMLSDRRRLITKKHFLPFRVLLNVGIDPNFPLNSFFFLALFREKFRFPAKTFLA